MAMTYPVRRQMSKQMSIRDLVVGTAIVKMRIEEEKAEEEEENAALEKALNVVTNHTPKLCVTLMLFYD